MAADNNFIQKAMRDRQIVLTIFTVLTILGVYALYKMPRQEFPEFTIRQGLVVGVYPGASSDQIEKQLTSKVEEYIFGFNEVNKQKTYSLSRENSMIIFVEVRGDLNRVDTDAFWSKLSHGLKDLKQELPAGVISLFANNNFGDTAAVILSLSSKSKSYKELETYMDDLEDDLRKLEGVSKIKHSGLHREQISIYIDDAKLSLYGIKPMTLLAALKTESSVNYSGELDNGRIVMPIHIPKRYHSEKDLAEQIIYSDPNGNIIRLKDVARIVRDYGEPDSYITVDGEKAVIITLEMQFGNNIVHFGKKVDDIVQRFSENIPTDIHVDKIADMPLAVDNAVGDFLKEFFIAVIAVIIVTILLLPRKIALITAASIPISILITLAILYAFGIELHTVTLAALIMVLGMVVDNGIVVIDNYIEKLDNGCPPWDAAWQSASEIFIPITTATLAIIAVFMPLPFFLTGMGHDFIKTFPITIAIALFISLLVALFFIPVISFMYIKKGLKGKEEVSGQTVLDRMQWFYDRTFEKTFKRSKTTVFVAILLVMASVVLLQMIPREVYPIVERNQFAIEVYLSSGASLDRTEYIVKDLEEILKKDKRVEKIAAFIGTSSPRFHATYAPNMPSKNYAQLIVNTTSNQATEDILNEYNTKYRDYYPEAYVRWKQLAMNLTKAAIEIRVSGNNLNKIKETAAQVTNIIKKAENVAWVRNDFEESIQLTPSNTGVYLDIKKDEANRLGFTRAVLAYSLMVGTKGLPLSTIWEDDYPVDILLRVDNRKSTLQDILDQYITSPFLFSSIQLRQLVDVKPEWSSKQIVRRNGVRTITVSVDVDRNVYASSVLKSIKPKVEKLILPENVEVEFGGEYEGEIQDYVPMSYALTAGIIINFFILLFQFKTIKASLLVMSTLFLGMLGAAVGLLAMDFPFGFTSFVGVMGLSGLVVRNGVILVDYANSLRRDSGFSVKEAALAAGKRRLRPIFLTSATTAIGVIPTMISRSLLWGPLASVICFGLIFSMVLTLYIVPVLYMYVYESEVVTPL